MPDTWEIAVRTAAAAMLRHPGKISDGLEAELYALLETLGTPDAERPGSTGQPDDTACPPHTDNATATSPDPPPRKG